LHPSHLFIGSWLGHSMQQLAGSRAKCRSITKDIMTLCMDGKNSLNRSGWFPHVTKKGSMLMLHQTSNIDMTIGSCLTKKAVPTKRIGA
jgi:hypothetical protein